MTARNDSDWLIHKLSDASHAIDEKVEDCNKDPCVRLFFARCFLLLPSGKEKPDTQARVQERLGDRVPTEL